MDQVTELKFHLTMMLITFIITFPVMYHYMKNIKYLNVYNIIVYSLVASFIPEITLFCLMFFVLPYFLYTKIGEFLK